MSVVYEWDVETLADGESADYEDGEVIDHSHAATYRECLEWMQRAAAPEGTRFAVVLVRDDDDRRAWAYVEGGKLPESFTDADGNDYKRVPARFHSEMMRA